MRKFIDIINEALRVMPNTAPVPDIGEIVITRKGNFEGTVIGWFKIVPDDFPQPNYNTPNSAGIFWSHTDTRHYIIACERAEAEVVLLDEAGTLSSDEVRGTGRYRPGFEFYKEEQEEMIAMSKAAEAEYSRSEKSGV